jgi:hypothetical protein
MKQVLRIAVLLFGLVACDEQQRKPENRVIPETATTEDDAGDKSRKNKNGETDCSDASFSGVNRGACKTSIVKGQPELFSSLEAFMFSLPDDDVMSSEAGISTDENDQRAAEELRNITIAQCWILAMKRNNDGDYHIIVGSGPDPKCDALFNIEVSGLPESSSPHYAALKKVRDDLENYFNGDCCFTRYKKFYKNPIAVRVTGSLFYDIEHAPPHLNIGPTGLKTTTAWELHPVTAITFL